MYVAFSRFFSGETIQHINNPSILPQSICSMIVIELVNICKIAEVSIASISGLAFIFLEAEINNHTCCVQGISNAFVICFKCCFSQKILVAFDLFFSFPDLDPAHRLPWNECYGRTIFLSIDHLRQKNWRLLFRYGESQGFFPKQLINLHFPIQFTHYLCIFLECGQVPFEVHVLKEPQHRLDARLIYRVISITDPFKDYCLDSSDWL
jgi:hypothetical protein